MKKILLLGSGELGKELTISLQRFGCYIIACDKYKKEKFNEKDFITWKW